MAPENRPEFNNMTHQSYIISPETGWILLGLLSVLWIVLGIYWGKKAKSMEGYMLAGRNVGLAFGMATVMATWVTSNTTMLAPQFALELGVWGMLAYSTEIGRASCRESVCQYV